MPESGATLFRLPHFLGVLVGRIILGSRAGFGRTSCGGGIDAHTAANIRWPAWRRRRRLPAAYGGGCPARRPQGRRTRALVATRGTAVFPPLFWLPSLTSQPVGCPRRPQWRSVMIAAPDPGSRHSLAVMWRCWGSDSGASLSHRGQRRRSRPSRPEPGLVLPTAAGPVGQPVARRQGPARVGQAQPRARVVQGRAGSLQPPYLTWAVVGRGGAVTRPPAEVAGIDQPFMIHDFTITEHYALFVVGPALRVAGWRGNRSGLRRRCARSRRHLPAGRGLGAAHRGRVL